MNQRYTDILNEPLVCAELKRAWENSNPGLTGGHEEGGFILKDAGGNFSVVRWAVGDRNSIFVPPHPGCKIEGIANASVISYSSEYWRRLSSRTK
ncbi:hypothetical protein [Chamaesiphon sp. OTE_20_metabat_361]|uniref:hypothetical protein n=1 Tax=Chamaesiphon sp. OTE_20_metabat_361 TaxID=2964689 RepID=UPI00286C4C5D|nr:hypothetical protein [Chamaesiphon sp. OTE_20_metabat_361]